MGLHHGGATSWGGVQDFVGLCGCRVPRVLEKLESSIGETSGEFYEKFDA
jgi:hypothetical protein